MLARAHCILIPVAPSAIDIHATANFIRDLLLAGKIRARDARLQCSPTGSAARCRCISRSERFLSSLSLAFLTRLGDSDVYVKPPRQGGDLRAGRLVSAAEAPGIHADRRVGRRRAKTPVDAKVIELGAPAGLKAAAASAGLKEPPRPFAPARARHFHGYKAGLGRVAERFTHSRFRSPRRSCCGVSGARPTGTDHAAGSGFRPQDRSREGSHAAVAQSVVPTASSANPQVKIPLPDR